MKLAYLCDIFEKMNALNISLQVKNMHIVKFMEQITAFIKKTQIIEHKNK